MEARFSAPVQTRRGTHLTSCTMGTGSFPGVKSGRGVKLTPHPLLVPWPWKGRAIPLLPLWAVRPVQSLSVCTRVHFTFFYFKFRKIFHRDLYNLNEITHQFGTLPLTVTSASWRASTSLRACELSQRCPHMKTSDRYRTATVFTKIVIW